jgi:hypothetical protein
MLDKLISDLSGDADLRQRFDTSPEQVLDQYGVEGEDRKALLARDLDALKSRLPGSGELLDKLLPSPRFFWPGNQMQVWGIEPASGSTGQPVNVTAKGEMFEDNATLTFQRPGAAVQATNVRVTSSGLESTLTATAQFAQAGAYDVVVQNPGTSQQASLPQGFTATGS